MFRFEHIEYLWALATLPLLALFMYWATLFRKKALQKLGDSSLLERLGPKLSSRKVVTRWIFLFTGLVFIIVGWANPQWGTRQQKVKRESADIFFALDISKSMWAEDTRPSRLERAKQLVLQLAEGFKAERQGLIIFAAEAYLALPLTFDYSAVELLASSANPGQAGTQGTSLKAVIEKAEESFQEGDNRSRLLLIISDGEDHEAPAIELAKEASQRGLTICTVGIGTERGSSVPIPEEQGGGFLKDRTGNMVNSKLNVEMLKEIAEAGGGVYFPLESSKKMTELLRKLIERLEKQEFEEAIFTEYESYFQYFLSIGMLFLILEFFMGDREKTSWRDFSFLQSKDLELLKKSD